MGEAGLPGDRPRRAAVARMIRVDHAGEYGAKRIYQGQLAVLGRGPKGDPIRHMQAQEQVHLDTFAALVARRRVRPTALLPLWHVAGFALGAATALLGERAADVAGALAAKRALELEAMDENLRSIQQQVWAAEDATKAAEDATKAANEYKAALEGVTDSIVDEIKRLRGITATTSLASLKAQFGILTAQARGGNIEALGKLPELSQAIEAATIADATSTLEIARIRAWLDRSLSETLASQGGSVDLASIASTSTFNGNQVGASTSGNQTADQISVLREEMRQALFQIAKNTGRSYDLLDRWDGDGLPETRTLA